MNTVGFLGTGRIAEPMVRSLSRQFPQSRILVSRRSKEIADRLTKLGNVEGCDNQALLDKSDTVVVCLLANVAREVLPHLVFKETHTVISVMADISLGEIGSLIAPARHPCVTIPLPFIEQGGCPLPVYPHSDELIRLFGEENMVIALNQESSIGPHFAATAVLSTTMKQLNTVAQWLGDKTADNTDAERYVAALVSGYLGALAKDGRNRFVEAMEDLSTEGGLNNQLRSHITASGFYDVLRQGLEDLNGRLIRNAAAEQVRSSGNGKTD